MVQVDEQVTYHPADGRAAVEATVTKVNPDGSINILYPHPNGNAAAEGVQASAENVQRGQGSHHFMADDGENPAETGPTLTELEELRADVRALTGAVSQLEARIKEIGDTQGEATARLAGVETKVAAADLDAMGKKVGAAATSHDVDALEKRIGALEKPPAQPKAAKADDNKEDAKS